jgi:hypothetical protein
MLFKQEQQPNPVFEQQVAGVWSTMQGSGRTWSTIRLSSGDTTRVTPPLMSAGS